MSKEYNAKNIEVLDGLDPVRKRPGMYIGSTSSRGLHHLIWEILDNSIDEHLADYCSEIFVKILENGSISIEDNGRGMPVDKHEKLNIPAVRVIHTVLHAGGKFNNDTYKISGGLHGVGASVVNALSEFFIVEVFKDKKHYKDEYEKGIPQTKLTRANNLRSLGKTKKQGTKTTFKPDDTIFESIKFNKETILEKLKEVSYLNKDLKITFIDERDENPEEIIFKEDKGIVGFIEEKHEEESLVHKEIIYVEDKKEGIEVEFALQYTNNSNENIFSFCNNINTQEGGTHVSGFKSALTKTINKYATETKFLSKKSRFSGSDIRSGLTAILSIKYPDPQFEGQTKTKLGNSDARTVVEQITALHLTLFFDRNKEILEKILERAKKSLKMRKAESKIKEKFNNKKTKISIDSKLASCSLKNNPDKGVNTEIFIVEGISAGGSAKQARDRKIQAILPLRGKVLNAEKSPINKILKNNEIVSMISAFGAGFGEGLGDDFDVNKLKYDKIILMTDADVDGSHIVTLILTFFFRYMPELIYEGKVFISLPPLYKVSHGKDKIEYAENDKELKKILKKINTSKYEVERNKGLGEMDAEELWDTTMNPENRTLIKVNMDDNLLSDKVTKILMGKKAKQRKEFIKTNADKAEYDV